VLAAEHLLDLAGVDLGRERIEAPFDVALDLLALLEPLHEHGEVVGPAAQRLDEREVLLEPAAALEDLLGLGLILPEVGRRDFQLEALELVGGAGGLKDSSAGRRPA
jgi:hypothetical protein